MAILDLGRVQLGALRAFWAARKRELRTSAVLVWAYPQVRAPYRWRNWQRRNIYRALSRWAVRAGRDREVTWRLRDDVR